MTTTTIHAEGLLMLAALAVVEAAGLPHGLRTLALVLGTFVGMAWWVRANRTAFDLGQWCECAPRTMTIRVIESRRPWSPERRGPAETVGADTPELARYRAPSRSPAHDSGSPPAGGTLQC
jgi:hypothetical protein